MIESASILDLTPKPLNYSKLVLRLTDGEMGSVLIVNKEKRPPRRVQERMGVCST